jgi:hypothetical protein
MHDQGLAALIRRAFCAIFCPCHRLGKRISRYSFKGISFTGEEQIMFSVKDTDVPGTVDVTLAFKDSKGKPAKVDGVPTWVASDTSIVDSITPAADGLSAKLHITDNVGASQVTVSADVDLGSGTTSTDFVDTVSVIAGDAVAADFQFGAVTPDTPTS